VETGRGSMANRIDDRKLHLQRNHLLFARRPLVDNRAVRGAGEKRKQQYTVHYIDMLKQFAFMRLK